MNTNHIGIFWAIWTNSRVMAAIVTSNCLGGPKFYAYVVCTPEERAHKICKIKDITLNYNNFLTVNLNSIRKLIMEKERRKQEEEKEGEMIRSVKSMF